MKTVSLLLPPKIDRHTLDQYADEYRRSITADATLVQIDCSQLADIDHYLVALLLATFAHTHEWKADVQLLAVPEELKRKFITYRLDTGCFLNQSTTATLFEAIGTGGIEIFQAVISFVRFQLTVVQYLPLHLIKHSGLKLTNFLTQVKTIGMDALPIVILLSFLVGLTLALQSANQLRDFGANIFIADLVAIGLTREMAPLMIGILLSGRTGAAITSEVSTMVITEEMDALRGMAVDPYSFVIVPKYFALMISQPLLTVLSDVMGVLGGSLVALFYLDLPLSTFFQRVIAAVSVGDLLSGMMKSLVFAWIIVSIGIFKGLHVGKGSEAVGKSTTSSVVLSLFAIIIADCVFSFVFYY